MVVAQKFERPRLGYEIGVGLSSGFIVWAHGQFRCGTYARIKFSEWKWKKEYSQKSAPLLIEGIKTKSLTNKCLERHYLVEFFRCLELVTKQWASQSKVLMLLEICNLKVLWIKFNCLRNDLLMFSKKMNPILLDFIKFTPLYSVLIRYFSSAVLLTLYRRKFVCLIHRAVIFVP